MIYLYFIYVYDNYTFIIYLWWLYILHFYLNFVYEFWVMKYIEIFLSIYNLSMVYLCSVGQKILYIPYQWNIRYDDNDEIFRSI